MATFYGEYERSLDGKGRVILPQKVREQLDEEGPGPLWLTLGLDRCIYLYSQSAWDRIVSKIRKVETYRTRDFTRKFFSMAMQVEPDKAGRILVPPRLLAAAQIERDLMVAGVLDHVEIWSRDRWDKNSWRVDEQGEYETLAEELFGPHGENGNGNDHGE